MITQLGSGATVAGYRLESVLGRGGMGVVYLAEDLRLGRKVAVKLIAPEFAADPRFRERFLREAELAASLDHPHVLPVYGAGETDGQLWIAMRYVAGEDLDALLAREGPLEPLRAVELARQVGDALDSAHSRGLVHRDVKPANVLVAPVAAGEYCYLTDFGLARAREDETVLPSGAHLSGTVAYAAPERLAGRFVDGRADVYSLGCVLFECLAGEPPFVRGRPSATVAAHIDEEPPSVWMLRPELPSQLDEIVASALAKEPGDRYATCSELCEQARAALDPVQPWWRSARTIVVVAALVLVAFVAALAITLTRNGAQAGPESPETPVSAPSSDQYSLVHLDAATGGVAIDGIELDGTPFDLAVDDRSLWVADSTTLSRIDPISEEVSATFDTTRWLSRDGAQVTTVGGDVWVLDARGNLARLAAGADALVPVEVPNNLPGYGYGYPQVAGGSVWAVDDEARPGSLVRVDPETGRTVARLERVVATVVVGDDFLWAVALTEDKSTYEYVRIDTATNEITRLTGLPRFKRRQQAFAAIAGAVVGEGSVWLPKLEIATILRLNPRTGAVQARLPWEAETITAGAGAVWIVRRDFGSITRLDLPAGTPEETEIGGELLDVEFAGDSVWMLVRDEG